MRGIHPLQNATEEQRKNDTEETIKQTQYKPNGLYEFSTKKLYQNRLDQKLDKYSVTLN